MICDTSGLLASLWPEQPESEACIAAIESADRRVISPLVLTELNYLIGRRVGETEASKAIQIFAAGDFELASLDWTDISTALDVVNNYRDLRIGLVDASLVVLAKRYRTDEILTLDQRHFRAIRSLSGRPFKLLPFDAD